MVSARPAGRPSRASRRIGAGVGAWSVASALIASLLAGAPAGAAEPTTIVRGALDLACAVRSRHDLRHLGDRLLGGRASGRATMSHLTWGRRWVYQLAGGRLTLDWVTPRKQLPQFRAQ